MKEKLLTRHEIVCVDFSVFEIPDPDPDSDPLEALINKEEQAETAKVIDFRKTQVRRLVRQLPEPERLVILLRYGLDGHQAVSDEQIATRLGMSRSGVWRARQRALEHLRSADEATALLQAA